MTVTQLMLLPVFLHVLLIAYLAFRLGPGRVAAVRSGQVSRKDVAIDNRNWPDALRKIGNNLDNQFQIPLVWYACVGLLMVTGLADIFTAGLSWAFVITRYVHSYIHTGSNRQPARFHTFGAGVLVVLVMWAWFGLRLYVIG